MRLAYIWLTGVTICLLASSCRKSTYPYGKRPSSIFTDGRAVAFCEAAVRGDLAKVDALLASGLNVHQQGANGVDLLFWALDCRDTRVFEKLLKRGADPNRLLPIGESVLERAVGLTDPTYLRLALEHGGNPDLVNPDTGRNLLVEALMSAAYTNIQVLVEYKASVDAASAHSDTAAAVAACLNRYDIVLYLMQNGADPGKTPVSGIGIADYLRDQLQNPHLLRHGPLWDAKIKVVDIMEARGMSVTELRRLIATPPAKNTEPLIREYRSW